MGLGTFASGVYAALSGYVGESGAYPLNLMHFVSSSRGTGFQTSEISEIHTCNNYDERPPATAGDDAEASDGSDDGGDGPDMETDVNTTTTSPALYQPPTEVFCGRELATSPSRVKLNIYGYTWGSKWATDTSGQEYFFYRVRLCFSRIQDWYINQARRGEGRVGWRHSKEKKYHAGAALCSKASKVSTLAVLRILTTDKHLAGNTGAGFH